MNEYFFYRSRNLLIYVQHWEFVNHANTKPRVKILTCSVEVYYKIGIEHEIFSFVRGTTTGSLRVATPIVKYRISI